MSAVQSFELRRQIDSLVYRLPSRSRTRMAGRPIAARIAISGSCGTAPGAGLPFLPETGADRRAFVGNASAGSGGVTPRRHLGQPQGCEKSYVYDLVYV